MRRPLLAAALLILAAACSGRDARAPFTDSRPPPGLAPRFWAPPGWTWGLVQVSDHPPVRYGVTGPNGAPRGHVLILPGYGEPAEAYFETVRDLSRRRYVVWVLERAGQGGSGRYTGKRDLGAVASLDDDASAIRTMIDEVIRPRSEAPLVIIGQGLGGLVALRALQQSPLPIEGLVLSSPQLTLDAPPIPMARLRREAVWSRRVGLGWLRPTSGGAWTRGPSAPAPSPDAERRSVGQSWQLANPDLRMGAPSLGWYAAYFDAVEHLHDTGLARIDTPVLMLGGGADHGASLQEQSRLCGLLPKCAERKLATGTRDLPLEADGVRNAWLGEIMAFIDEKIPADAGP